MPFHGSCNLRRRRERLSQLHSLRIKRCGLFVALSAAGFMAAGIIASVAPWATFRRQPLLYHRHPCSPPAAPVPPVSLPVTGGPAKTSSAWPLMAVTVAPIGIVLGSWLRGGFSGIEASSAGGDLAVDPGRTSLTTGTSNALSCLALAPCPWRCSFRYASSSRATSRAPTLLLR